MSRIEWSLQDAKNRFSAVVDAAIKGMPQRVTLRGKPAVMVISVEAPSAYRYLCTPVLEGTEKLTTAP